LPISSRPKPAASKEEQLKTGETDRQRTAVIEAEYIVKA